MAGLLRRTAIGRGKDQERSGNRRQEQDLSHSKGVGLTEKERLKTGRSVKKKEPDGEKRRRPKVSGPGQTARKRKPEVNYRKGGVGIER